MQREKGIFHAEGIPRYTFNAKNLQRKKNQRFQKDQKFGYPKKIMWSNSFEQVLNAFVA